MQLPTYLAFSNVIWLGLFNWLTTGVAARQLCGRTDRWSLLIVKNFFVFMPHIPEPYSVDANLDDLLMGTPSYLLACKQPGEHGGS